MTTTRAPRPETVREHLVRRHAPALLALARRLLRRDEPACAAVRAAFAAALDAALELDAREAEARLRRAVVEACLASLPRRPAVAPALPAPPAPAAWRALVEVGHDTLRVATCRSLDALPDADRVLLLLSDVEGLGLRQTADWLGLTVATARRRLHAARHALLAKVTEAAAPTPRGAPLTPLSA